MIYTLTISLLIEKPFCLLRPQSFSFQIVSEFIDIFVKFSNFMSRGGAFDSLLCAIGRIFVHNDCPQGRNFAPSSSVPGGMDLNETDTCIMNWLQNLAQSNREINVTHDWKWALEVSRTNEVDRGMGKRRNDDIHTIKIPKNVSETERSFETIPENVGEIFLAELLRVENNNACQDQVEIDMLVLLLVTMSNRRWIWLMMFKEIIHLAVMKVKEVMKKKMIKKITMVG